GHRARAVAAQPVAAPAHRQPHQDDDGAHRGALGVAARTRARDQAGGGSGRLQGRRAAARPARGAAEHAVRAAAALRQRRRDRPRAERRRQRGRVRRAHEPRGRAAGDGLHALLLPLRLLRRRQLLLPRRPRRAGARGPPAAAPGRHRAPPQRGAAVSDQGRQAVPVQQQPASDLPLPGPDRAEDGLHQRLRQMPGGDSRAPRRAPGRGPAALLRARQPGAPASRPGLRARLSPGARGRGPHPARRLSRAHAPGRRPSRSTLRPRVGYRLTQWIDWPVSQKEKAVDLDDTPQQAAYRSQVRSWLEQHASEAPVLEGPEAITDEQELIAARRAWQGKLAEGGLAGVTWPKEFGGQGLGPIEQVICNQEIGRARVPGILDAIGVGMLGPTIIAHGTDEQKARYLGAMLHGDEVWCQLFSEPAAGSDLAAVQARARLQDDGSWRLSGQKVWTTNAQFASFGLLLARTDPDVPKHNGLTMFIVPMDAPGVTIRGLRQISGEAEFNEVFFDDVPLAADAACGPVSGGWGTALTTLMYERLTIGLGSEGLGYRADRFARAIAADEEARRDPD